MRGDLDEGCAFFPQLVGTTVVSARDDEIR